jgi:hypothetical protein
MNMYDWKHTHMPFNDIDSHIDIELCHICVLLCPFMQLCVYTRINYVPLKHILETT